MARHLEKMENGSFRETITDTTACRWLYDDVCCNEKCHHLAFMPTPRLICAECKYFTKEVDICRATTR